MYDINPEEQHDDRDDNESEYIEYKSKTQLGRRYDTIIALYGAVNAWTLYCYWFRDSIIKQTIMLIDKSGLRKKSRMSSQKYKETNAETLNMMWGDIVSEKTSKEQIIEQIRAEQSE